MSNDDWPKATQAGVLHDEAVRKGWIQAGQSPFDSPLLSVRLATLRESGPDRLTAAELDALIGVAEAARAVRDNDAAGGGVGQTVQDLDRLGSAFGKLERA